MTDISKVYKHIVQMLSQNEAASPSFEADLLLEFVLGKRRREIALDYLVSHEDFIKLQQLAQRRCEGYPLQYILGQWQFFDLDLAVGEGVLIPRQDTEIVCETAFTYLKNLPDANVLDLCAGSGAIALAIKRFCPNCHVLALEKSAQAMQYLNKNIQKTGLQVLGVLGDVFFFDEDIEDNTFDLIISNPPYIDPELKGTLQKEVAFEPEMALFASNKGLRFYRHIAQYYKSKLKQEGMLIFEYGFDQAQEVKSILLDFGYNIIEEIIDLGGNPRGVVAKRPK